MPARVRSACAQGWVAMQSDLAHVWVVEFYADWCGHCKQFAPAFEKAAGSLAGVVRFGGVNADGPKSVLKEVGVGSYPTVKVYLPELEPNPYTGKRARKALDYDGPRTAKALLAFVSAAMPNLVVPLASAADHDALLARGAAHLADAAADAHAGRAILFSAKSETSLLLKSLALRLRGRLALGEAKGLELGGPDEGAMARLARAYGVTELPALVVVPAAAASGDDAAAGASAAAPLARYAGEMKAEPLWAFLEAHAGAEPAPPPAGALRRALDGVLRPLDGALYEAEVKGSEGAWVLAFERGSTDLGADDAAEPARVPALGRLASQLRGQALLGLVNASEPAGAALAELFGVREFPALRVLPYGSANKEPTRALAVADGAAARKVAGESLPAELVPLVQSDEIDGLLSKAVGAPGAAAKDGPLATCVLFSDKASAPPLLRALALNFAGALGFAMVPGSRPETLERFSLTKLPSLLCLWTDGAVGADGRVNMQGSKYDEASGPFAFDSIGMYLAGLAQQIGGAGWADRMGARAGRRADGGADGADDEPLPALVAAHMLRLELNLAADPKPAAPLLAFGGGVSAFAASAAPYTALLRGAVQPAVQPSTKRMSLHAYIQRRNAMA
jgi:thiol-disulfide isomerase/thioredoxin